MQKENNIAFPKPSKQNPRAERFCPHSSHPGDSRTFGELDRDRILYSDEFRRLAGVTQVAAPREGYLFHNRLTHTLEVAQIARRIAQNIQRKLAGELGNKASDYIDPDVVEAAAFAHDLGHPPFGHVGEDELSHLCEDDGDADGFEGNAQSFRILTRVSIHRESYYGLNLSRATLSASLKYPWKRELRDKESKKYRKFGVYRDDIEQLSFAVGKIKEPEKTLEAQIMDYADDIAYSVHDLDDFYKVGFVPLDELVAFDDAFAEFRERWNGEPGVHFQPPADLETYLPEIREIMEFYLPAGIYSGTSEQRAHLKQRTSTLINTLVTAVSVDIAKPQPKLKVNRAQEVTIQFLKRLIWDYVIQNPNLTTQQIGHRRILRTLFEVYGNAVFDNDKSLIPPRFRKQLEELADDSSKARKVRLTADIISGLTDSQAHNLYLRLHGVAPGAVTDAIGS